MPKDEQIHKAAYKGELAAVENIIKEGFDINAIGAGNRTALHRAVGGGHEEVVCFLINNNADVNVVDANGRTPLHWAAISDSIDCANRLLSTNYIDINKQTKTGATALHMAIENNNANFALFLLNNGCRTDIKDFDPSRPKTALMMAEEKKMNSVVKRIKPESGCCDLM
ncbi:Serine/threonine-protein kinase tnni3k [Bonamia ostreae]|uniref:Serine/threonine-protein kinase tnni3k n=1 Tax=Bonamia ostreae TaxID=126728 RepID=A0ABV2AK14_9EUKA